MKVKDVLDLMKDEDVEYVDIRFTDPKGKLQHVTLVATWWTRTSSRKASCSTARRSRAGSRSTSPT
jgi:glutamine synthetase